MDQKDFFNSMADQWDEINKHNLIKAELMVGLLDIKHGDKVLDVGTGTGVLLPILSLFTNENDITAIDVAEEMIRVAKQKFKDTGITFIAGDALDYPFEAESFDFVICYSMFPHFPDKKKAIECLIRLLKKGGKLAVLHSSSRDEINRHHSGCEEVVKEDKLPYADIIMDYMNHLGLREEILIDNEEMYLVCGRKL
jgi:demethylmenaquinone methyltransferase/2-methoxy-6-polyprenyl-1,4-benzoquinol methylase